MGRRRFQIVAAATAVAAVFAWLLLRGDDAPVQFDLEAGETVDLSQSDHGFLFGGQVDHGLDVERVTVTVLGATAEAHLDRRDGETKWYLPVNIPEPGTFDFTTTAILADGSTRESTIALDLVPTPDVGIIRSPLVVDVAPGDIAVSDDGTTASVSASVDLGPGFVLAVGGDVDSPVPSAAYVVEEVLDRSESAIQAKVRPAEIEDLFHQIVKPDAQGLRASRRAPTQTDRCLAGVPPPYHRSYTFSTPRSSFGSELKLEDDAGLVTLSSPKFDFEIAGEVFMPNLYEGNPFAFGSLQILRLNAIGELSFSLDIGINGKITERERVPILSGVPIPLPSVPILGPVWVTPKVDLDVVASTTGNASIRANAKTPFVLGFHYDNGEFTNLNCISVDTVSTTATPRVNAEAEASVSISPNLSFDMFYGAVSARAALSPGIIGIMKKDLVNDRECVRLAFQAHANAEAQVGTAEPWRSPSLLLVSEAFYEDGDEKFCSPEDKDQDTIADSFDNCPSTPNTDQADADRDGRGDACERPNDAIRSNDRRAGSHGDPHIVTFDGLSYSFQVTGDFKLAESIDETFALHARFTRTGLNSQVSMNRALAARVGSSVLTFGDGPQEISDPFIVRLDDEVIKLTTDRRDLPGGVLAWLDGRRFKLEWPDGTSVSVGHRPGGHFEIELSDTAPEMRGLLGNANGDPTDDLVGPANKSVDVNGQGLLQSGFVEHWSLASTDSLFSSVADPAELHPQYPTDSPSLSSLEATKVDIGHRLCRNSGLSGVLYNQCVFDVAVTGNGEWAREAEAMIEAMQGAFPPIALFPTIELSGRLSSGSPASGNVTAQRVHEYTIAIQPSLHYVLEFSRGNCPEFGFGVALLSADQTPLVGGVEFSVSKEFPIPELPRPWFLREVWGLFRALLPPDLAPGNYLIRLYNLLPRVENESRITSGLRYDFVLLGVDAEPLASGQRFGPRDLPVGDRMLLEFDAPMAGHGYIDRTGDAESDPQTIGPNVFVVSPSGSVVFSSLESGEFGGGFAVPEPGTYRMYVSGAPDEGGWPGSSSSGAPASKINRLDFVLHLYPEPTAEMVTLPADFNGRLTGPGERQTYSFTAEAGDQIMWSMKQCQNKRAMLLGPNAEQVGPSIYDCGYTEKVSIDRSGVYTLVIESKRDEVGSFRLSINVS